MTWRSVGSYFEMTPSMYQPPPAGTADAELAPVPGWGANPLRSGPPILATNGGLWSNESMVPHESIISRWSPIGQSDDPEESANQGYIAIAAAGGIVLGWFLCWAFLNHQKKSGGFKANKSRKRSRRRYRS